MDQHQLHFEQSVAMHAAVARKLRSHPELLDRACAKIDEWLAAGGAATPLLSRWKEILARPLEDVCAVLIDRSEEAAWLRKASPFAGALAPRERERILREVRLRFESAA